MVDFATVWPFLVEQTQEVEYVETFKQGNKNDARYDEIRDAISFNSRATAKEYWTVVPRKHWKTAWDDLHQHGELKPRQFFHRTNVRRGSTLVPFLQTALDLPVDRDERVIYPPHDYSRFERSAD